MNASASSEADHQAYICLGSNIAPAENLRQAVGLLRQLVKVLRVSACWETEAVTSSSMAGIQWPNFLNAAVLIATPHGPAEIKEQVIAPIEQRLGRVRTSDKYAPRTIDLDLTIYDGRVLDADVWRRVYLALIFAEFIPELKNPLTGEAIRDTAARLSKEQFARKRADVTLE